MVRRSVSQRVCLWVLIVLFVSFISACSASQTQADPNDQDQKKTQTESTKVKDDQDQVGEHSLAHNLLLYLPNRVFDLLDVFRARLRVGPGFAAGVRATKIAQAYAGTYFSVYAGLPGPRLRRIPKLPVGLESYNGVDISLVEASTGAGIGPDYSPTEFGVTLYPLLLGFDIGFDPFEVVDFLAGFFLFDPRDDDF